MPAINSLASGVYSAPGTWVGGVPPAAPNWPDIQNLHVVTLDMSIDVGPDDAVNPAIQIRSGGTLLVAAGAGANYTITCQGDLVVDNGGTFSIGTDANEIPWGRNITVYLNKSAAPVTGKYGLRATGAFIAHGWQPSVWMAKMISSAAIGDDHIHTDGVGDWHASDIIAIAPTNRPPATTGLGCQDEFKIIDHFVGNDIFLTTNLVNARDYTALYIEPEVINITRNVVLTSHAIATPGYVEKLAGNAAAVLTMKGVEFLSVGTSVLGKSSLVNAHTLSKSTLWDCSFYKCNAIVLYAGALNVFWDIQRVSVADCCRLVAGQGMFLGDLIVTAVFDRVCMIGVGGVFSLTGILIGNNSNIVANISNIFISGVAANVASSALSLSNTPRTTPVRPSFSNIVLHSGSGVGMQPYTVNLIDFSNVTIYRCSIGLNVNISYSSTWTNTRLFGNVTGFAANPTTNGVTFTDLYINGDTTYACTNAFTCGALSTSFKNCDFHNAQIGVVSGIFTAVANHWYLNGSYAVDDEIRFHNSIINPWPGPSWVSLSRVVAESSYMASEDHMQVPGAHHTSKVTGYIDTDTVIKQVGTVKSCRLTPKIVLGGGAQLGVNKHKSPIQQVAVKSGQSFNISVYVRESVLADGTAYTGARIRLIVKKNVAMGYATDTLLDTATIASVGAWEQLHGAYAIAPRDGVIEFYVDCDGTLGWINAQSWVVS